MGSGPGLVRAARAFGADLNEAAVREFRAVIAAADASGAVLATPQGYAITDAALPSGWETLVSASVMSASVHPVAIALKTARAQGAEDTGKVISELITKFQALQPFVENIKRLESAKADAHWWGLEILLDDASAKALSELLGKNVRNLFTDVVPMLGAVGAAAAIPQIAAAGVVIAAVGSALSAWIDSQNKGKGVKLTLFFYAVPWVTSLE